MLKSIVSFSVRFRGVVIALAIAFFIYGVLVLGRAKYDVFPEFAPPQVAIQTEAVGFTPEQVEVLVTTPIENAINGVPGVSIIRSQSIQGLSAITAIFSAGTDLYRARQTIAERKAALFGFWGGCRDESPHELDDHTLSLERVATHPFVKVIFSDYPAMSHRDFSK